MRDGGEEEERERRERRERGTQQFDQKLLSSSYRTKKSFGVWSNFV